MMPETPAALRVLVVDDHDIARWGLSQVLAAADGIGGCVAVGDGTQAVPAARTHRPHVALIDMFLSNEHGLGVCRRVSDAHPPARVLLMSGTGWLHPRIALAAGARGFLSKAWAASMMAEAVRRAAAGHLVFAASDEAVPRLDELEHALLRQIAQGASNRELERRFALAPGQVRTRVSALLAKLDAPNRAAAIDRAHRLGLLP